MEPERLTIELEEGTKDRLREIARATGHTVIHGRWAGQGSIAGLMQAIADGTVICVSKAAVDAAKGAAK